MLISGEPGIGKSRLTAALSEHIASEPHTRLRYFCSPHHQDSALYPFIAQLERAAGFARDDTVDARLGKLRALLAPGTRDDDDIALLSRAAVVAEFRRGPQPQPAAQTGEDVRGIAQPARSRGAAPAGADGVRGRPLDRPDLARTAGSDRRSGARDCRCCWRSPFAPSSSRPGAAAPMSRAWRSTGSANATARRWCTLWPAMPRSPPRSSRRSSSAPTGCRCLSRS